MPYKAAFKIEQKLFKADPSRCRKILRSTPKRPTRPVVKYSTRRLLIPLLKYSKMSYEAAFKIEQKLSMADPSRCPKFLRSTPKSLTRQQHKTSITTAFKIQNVL